MRNTRFLTLTLTAFLISALALVAQDDDVPVVSLVYIDADDASEYVQVEREIWVPVHAQQIRDGNLLNWQLYEVVNPWSNGGEYNYLIVETYPNWAATEAPYAEVGKLIEEVHGPNSAEYMLQRTGDSRDMVNMEHWLWQMGTDGEFSADQVKYVLVDWMDVKPGQGGDYMDMEREYYLPVHQKRVDAGKILGWGLWSKIGYSEVPGSIDAATTANFASYDAIWDSYPEGAWESAHGEDVDQDEVYEKMRGTRVMTGSTLLRLIEYVDASNINQKK